jgi:hypothetical protein
MHDVGPKNEHVPDDPAYTQRDFQRTQPVNLIPFAEEGLILYFYTVPGMCLGIFEKTFRDDGDAASHRQGSYPQEFWGLL